MGTVKAVAYENGADFSASPAIGVGVSMQAEAAVGRPRRGQHPRRGRHPLIDCRATAG
jgi:hypothetical protein